MALKIHAIADSVLPVSAPPQDEAGAIAVRQQPTIAANRVRERALYAAPESGEINIARWQCQNGMKVIRQHHDCIDSKPPLGYRDPKCCPQ